MLPTEVLLPATPAGSNSPSGISISVPLIRGKASMNGPKIGLSPDPTWIKKSEHFIGIHNCHNRFSTESFQFQNCLIIPFSFLSTLKELENKITFFLVFEENAYFKPEINNFTSKKYPSTANPSRWVTASEMLAY